MLPDGIAIKDSILILDAQANRMEEKHSIISQLAELSKVDGRVTEDEIGLLKRMGNMLGLSDAEIVEIIKNPKPFNPPEGELDRMTQFHRLVLMMNVDGEVSPNEIQYLKLAGVKLGLQADVVEEVLREMVKYPNNVVPPEKLLEIYKKNLN